MDPVHPEIKESTICADDGDTRSGCPGDSGGPLIVKGKNASFDVLVGVHRIYVVYLQVFLTLLVISHQSIAEFHQP
jgi:hypothetical protein